MNLKNKKTGEIINLLSKPSFVKRNDDYLQSEVNTFNSLAELNEEWEDYEETKSTIKDVWFNSTIANGHFVEIDFISDEEAIKAVEKLKAWKRLKDKGFKLSAVVDNFFCLDIYMKGEKYNEIKDDLKIVFGGEE